MVYTSILKFRVAMKKVLLLIFGFCVVLIAVAYFMEYQMGLEPCPMCIIQRIAIALTGLAALIGYFHDSWFKFYFSLTTVFSIAGAASAIRHLYLQSLPEDQVPFCGPDLGYLLDNAYFSDALRMLFIGDGNCAEVVWSLFGVSIPGWVLIWCIINICLSVSQLNPKTALSQSN